MDRAVRHVADRRPHLGGGGEKTTPGNAESAPHVPNLLPKMVATTVVASIVFAALYAIIVHHVITLDEIPFFPRYERMQ